VLTFRILGPLEVHDGEQLVPLPRRKHRVLLALLLLRTGETVSTDALVEQLWGDRPPRTAKDALINYVSLLRKALGPEVLLTRDPGYALDISAEQTDLGRFERLAAEARATESPVEQAEKLREALALWRGAPFADLAFEPFAQIETARLEELRLAVEQDLIDAELALGHHAEVISKLETLIQQHPYGERLRGQQMLALYRASRQAEALEAYQTTRRLLDDELGLEPSPELRELEQAVLRQDPALAAPKAETARVLPSRRTVTVLFADLVDSTPLAEQLDPEALQTVLTRYFGAMREAVERYGGTVEKFIGDAVMAVFGVPKAHEDDALRAIRAAVDIHDALRAFEDGLEARIGINTGEVITGGETALVTGATVNLAKRLEQAAPSGEVVISAGTLRLVRHAVTAEAAAVLGAGKETPVPTFRLIEIADSAPALERRLDASLVGRQEEVAQLRHAFERVREQGQCRVVTVLGDAGIGKTRLILEFESELGREVSVLRGSCVSYGEGATYLPLAEMLAQAGVEFAALVADANSTGEVAFRVRERFERLAAKRPLVLVFEDVHWAEQTLLDLIDYLDERAEGPILCVCSARPELEERRPSRGDAFLELKPLSDEQLHMLVDSLEHDLEAEQLARIVETSEGNPLFAEQLVAYGREDLRGLATVAPSIEALLASRIDLLAADQRATLQRAAIIGRQFSEEAIRALGPIESLRELESAGLVHAAGDELRFHHVLVRDVAYTAIPKSERADLHERHADWLEEQPAGSDEIIGYHLEQAHLYLAELGDTGDHAHQLAIGAGSRLESAGQHASDRHDVSAAVNLLERALRLHDPDDPAVPLRINLARMLDASGRNDLAVATANDAAELATASGDKQGALRARLVATRINWWLEVDLTSADLRALLEEARPVFEQACDDQGLSEVYRMIAELEGNRCHKSAALDALAAAARHARRAGDVGSLREIVWAAGYMHLYGPTPVKQSLVWLETEGGSALYPAEDDILRGLLLMMLGSFDEAAALLEEGIARAAEFGIQGTGSGWVHLANLRGDRVAAEREARRSCQAMERSGSTGVLSTMKGLLADSLYELGRDLEAEEAIAQGEALSMTDDVTNQILFRRVRAKVLARRGEQDRAEDLARESVAISEQTDVLNERGDAHSDLAEVLVMAGRTKDAAAELDEALALYEQKGNLVMVERAQKRLAELRS
jgi:class 3 adenylate cyclase